MPRGTERESDHRLAERVGLFVAIVLLAGATFGPSVGAALGAGGSSAGSPVSASLPPVPDPTTDTDSTTGPDRATDGESTRAGPERPDAAPNETSRRGPPDSPPSDRSATHTTDAPTTGDSTRPTRGESPSTTSVRATPKTSVADPSTTGAPTSGPSDHGADATDDNTGSPPSGEGPEGSGRSPDRGGPSGSSPGGPSGSDPGPGGSGGPGNSVGTGRDESVGRGPGGSHRDDARGTGRGSPADPPGDPDSGSDWVPDPSTPGTGETDLPGERGRDANRPEIGVNRTIETHGSNASGSPDPPDPDVNANVRNAAADEPVSVDVTDTASPGDDVSFSSVAVTPADAGSFTVNVTAGRNPIAGKTPSAELSNSTRPLAYLSVDHSIDDADIREVAFTFRVRTDRLNASEREEVALYRFKRGTWNELPTALVRETDDHYVYRVRSPGLSEFAVGKQRPDFEIVNASLSDATVSVGDAIRVRVRVTNRGHADGTFTADLAVDGERVASKRLTIASDGGVRQTTFERRLTRAGTYDVSVGGQFVGEVSVDGTTSARGNSRTASATGASTDAETLDRDASRSRAVSFTWYLGVGFLPPVGTTGPVSDFGAGVAVVGLLAGFAAGRTWQR